MSGAPHADDAAREALDGGADQAVHEAVDATDPVALARALIACPSVTPHDEGALDVVERALRPLGFAVERLMMRDEDTPTIANLYAHNAKQDASRPPPQGSASQGPASKGPSQGSSASQGPVLCFAGHTDVVPPGAVEAWTHPPFAATITDGRLYGRGAVDMKGAIAAFVAALARLHREHGTLPGALSLLITGDEEGPAINGTVKVLAWMKEQGLRIDACVVGEPTNPDALGDEIKIGRRGSLTGTLTVSGHQGHVAYPAQADNPVPKLARIIDHLSNLTLDTGNENFEPSNLEVTLIKLPPGSANVIPGEATAVFNVRYNDQWSREMLEAFLSAQVETAASACEAEATLTYAGTGTVFLTEPGPLVDTMKSAIEAVTGRVPALTTGGGTSDARFIQAYAPVIEFGLVNRTIHAVDEHVALDDLETLTAIYQRFIEDFFAAHG